MSTDPYQSYEQERQAYEAARQKRLPAASTPTADSDPFAEYERQRQEFESSRPKPSTDIATSAASAIGAARSRLPKTPEPTPEVEQLTARPDLNSAMVNDTVPAAGALKKRVSVPPRPKPKTDVDINFDIPKARQYVQQEGELTNAQRNQTTDKSNEHSGISWLQITPGAPLTAETYRNEAAKHLGLTPQDLEYYKTTTGKDLLTGGSPYRPGQPLTDEDVQQLYEDYQGKDLPLSMADSHRQAVETFKRERQSQGIQEQRPPKYLSGTGGTLPQPLANLGATAMGLGDAIPGVRTARQEIAGSLDELGVPGAGQLGRTGMDISDIEGFDQMPPEEQARIQRDLQAYQASGRKAGDIVRPFVYGATGGAAPVVAGISEGVLAAEDGQGLAGSVGTGAKSAATFALMGEMGKAIGGTGKGILDAAGLTGGARTVANEGLGYLTSGVTMPAAGAVVSKLTGNGIPDAGAIRDQFIEGLLFHAGGKAVEGLSNYAQTGSAGEALRATVGAESPEALIYDPATQRVAVQKKGRGFEEVKLTPEQVLEYDANPSIKMEQVDREGFNAKLDPNSANALTTAGPNPDAATLPLEQAGGAYDAIMSRSGTSRARSSDQGDLTALRARGGTAQGFKPSEQKGGYEERASVTPTPENFDIPKANRELDDLMAESDRRVLSTLPPDDLMRPFYQARLADLEATAGFPRAAGDGGAKRSTWQQEALATRQELINNQGKYEANGLPKFGPDDAAYIAKLEEFLGPEALNIPVEPAPGGKFTPPKTASVGTLDPNMDALALEAQFDAAYNRQLAEIEASAMSPGAKNKAIKRLNQLYDSAGAQVNPAKEAQARAANPNAIDPNATGETSTATPPASTPTVPRLRSQEEAITRRRGEQAPVVEPPIAQTPAATPVDMNATAETAVEAPVEAPALTSPKLESLTKALDAVAPGKAERILATEAAIETERLVAEQAAQAEAALPPPTAETLPPSKRALTAPPEASAPEVSLAEQIEAAKATPPPEPPTADPKLAIPGGENLIPRKTITSLGKAGVLDPAKIEPRGKYEQLSNEDAFTAADAYIEERGIDATVDSVAKELERVKGDSTLINARGIRAGDQMIKQLLEARASGDTVTEGELQAKIDKLSYDMGEISTRYGQEAQILSQIPSMHPLMVVKAVEGMFDGANMREASKTTLSTGRQNEAKVRENLVAKQKEVIAKAKEVKAAFEAGNKKAVSDTFKALMDAVDPSPEVRAAADEAATSMIKAIRGKRAAGPAKGAVPSTPKEAKPAPAPKEAKPTKPPAPTKEQKAQEREDARVTKLNSLLDKAARYRAEANEELAQAKGKSATGVETRSAGLNLTPYLKKGYAIALELYAKGGYNYGKWRDAMRAEHPEIAGNDERLYAKIWPTVKGIITNKEAGITRAKSVVREEMGSAAIRELTGQSLTEIANIKEEVLGSLQETLGMKEKDAKTLMGAYDDIAKQRKSPKVVAVETKKAERRTEREDKARERELDQRDTQDAAAAKRISIDERKQGREITKAENETKRDEGRRERELKAEDQERAAVAREENRLTREHEAEVNAAYNERFGAADKLHKRANAPPSKPGEPFRTVRKIVSDGLLKEAIDKADLGNPDLLNDIGKVLKIDGIDVTRGQEILDAVANFDASQGSARSKQRLGDATATAKQVEANAQRGYREQFGQTDAIIKNANKPSSTPKPAYDRVAELVKDGIFEEAIQKAAVGNRELLDALGRTLKAEGLDAKGLRKIGDAAKKLDGSDKAQSDFEKVIKQYKIPPLNQFANEAGISFKDLAMKGQTEIDAARQKLVDAVVKESGAQPDEAANIARATEERFDAAIKRGQAEARINKGVGKEAKLPSLDPDAPFTGRRAETYIQGVLKDKGISAKLSRATKAKLKAKGTSLTELVAKYESLQAGDARAAIENNLATELGLTGAEATQVTKLALDAYDALADSARRQKLDSILKPVEKSDRKRLTLMEKLLQIANLKGYEAAANDRDVAAALNEKYGLSGIDSATAKKLQDLAIKAQGETDPSKKGKAQAELMYEIEKLAPSPSIAKTLVYLGDMTQIAGPLSQLPGEVFRGATELGPVRLISSFIDAIRAAIPGVNRVGMNVEGKAVKPGERTALARTPKEGIEAGRSIWRAIEDQAYDAKYGVDTMPQLTKTYDIPPGHFKNKLGQTIARTAHSYITAAYGTAQRATHYAVYADSMAEFARQRGITVEVASRNMELVDRANKEAEYAAALDTNWLNTGLGALKRSLDAVSLNRIHPSLPDINAGMYVLPYVRQRSAAILRALEYTPGIGAAETVKAVLETSGQLATGKPTTVDLRSVERNIARQIVGTAGFAIARILYQAGGIIWPPSDKDDSKAAKAYRDSGVSGPAFNLSAITRNIKQSAGIGEYDPDSTQFKPGDFTVSLNVAGNLATSVMLASQMLYQKASDADYWDSAIRMGILSSEQVLSQNPAFADLGKVIGSETPGQDILERLFSRFVPSLARQARTYEDEERRRAEVAYVPKGSGSSKASAVLSTAANNALNSIPLASRSLPSEISPFSGQPLPSLPAVGNENEWFGGRLGRAVQAFVLAKNAGRYNPDAATKMAIDLFNEFPRNTSRTNKRTDFMPGASSIQTITDASGETRDVAVNDKQRESFLKRFGTDVKQIYDISAKSKPFQALPKESRAKILEAHIKDAARRAQILELDAMPVGYMDAIDKKQAPKDQAIFDYQANVESARALALFKLQKSPMYTTLPPDFPKDKNFRAEATSMLQAMLKDRLSGKYAAINVKEYGNMIGAQKQAYIDILQAKLKALDVVIPALAKADWSIIRARVEIEMRRREMRDRGEEAEEDEGQRP